LFKADFHMHTKYSMDSALTPEDIVKRCLELGINCIAVSDHGTVEGGLRTREIAPFPVIVAEEILTTHGEIMGLFLTESIPSGIEVEDAIERIKAQGGLVNVPHAFDVMRPSALGGKILERIKKDVDVIEVFNARVVLPIYNKQAVNFAKKNNLPGTAGSDSHTLNELGHAWVEMPEFTGKEDFLPALRQGTIVGQLTNPFVHVHSVKNKILKKLNGW